MSTGPPVFVIALANSTRAPRLRDRLTELGIPFEQIDAVNGRHLDADTIAEVYEEKRAIRRTGRPLGRGEIGCAMSHRNVYRLMVERDIALALVLEEDAIPGPGFETLWRSVQNLAPEIELLSLYSESGFVRRDAGARCGAFTLHKATYRLTGAVGYVLRRSLAQALLEFTRHIEDFADWPLERPERAQWLALPMPISHDGIGSVLEPERKLLRTRYLPAICRGPRWLRVAVYLSFLGYLLRPHHYQGLRAYYRREVAGRIRNIFAPGQVNVRLFLAPAADFPPPVGLRQSADIGRQIAERRSEAHQHQPRPHTPAKLFGLPQAAHDPPRMNRS